MKPTGTMGAWYQWLFSDLRDFQRNSELKESFSHLYSLGHHLCLRALCYVRVLDDVVRKLGSDSIKTDYFRAITHCHRVCLN